MNPCDYCQNDDFCDNCARNKANKNRSALRDYFHGTDEWYWIESESGHRQE